MDDKILKTIFDALQNDSYCIVKLDESSLGKKGGDVDIYTPDIAKIGKKILHIANKLINESTYARVVLTEHPQMRHAYIDFYKDNELAFRFDIFGKLPSFRTIGVKKDLFDLVIAKTIQKTLTHGDESITVFVPEPTYDLLLRYIEYSDQIDERADKIKHLQYVSSHLEDIDQRMSFFSALNTYVLKRKPEKPKLPWGIRRVFHLGKKAVRKVLSIFIAK